MDRSYLAPGRRRLSPKASLKAKLEDIFGHVVLDCWISRRVNAENLYIRKSLQGSLKLFDLISLLTDTRPIP